MKFDVIDAPEISRLPRQSRYSELFDAIPKLPPGKCISVALVETGAKKIERVRFYVCQVMARRGTPVSTRIDGDTLLIFKKEPPPSRP